MKSTLIFMDRTAGAASGIAIADFMTATLQSQPQESHSIGFLITSTIACIVSLPDIIGFPKFLILIRDADNQTRAMPGDR